MAHSPVRAAPTGSPWSTARPTAEVQVWVLARCALALRGGVGIAAFVAAMLAPGEQLVWSYGSAGVNAIWTVGFAVSVLVTRRITPAAVATEITLTSVFCLCQGLILPAALVSNGVSWIAGLVSITMAVVNLAYPYRRAIPLCLIVAACHLLGSRHAGVADGGLGTALIHLLQIAAMSLLVALLRAAANLADRVLAGLRQEAQLSAAARSHHDEQAARSDDLHGKVLAPLTAVATGGILQGTTTMRRQARTATDVLRALASGQVSSGLPDVQDGRRVRLDEHLRDVVGQADLRVESCLDLVWTDVATADCVARAVEEALINITRHSGVDRASLRLTCQRQTILVEVEDRGRGFSPQTIPRNRYGLRQVIVAAMARIGGHATIRSSLGQGTLITLRCPL